MAATISTDNAVVRRTIITPPSVRRRDQSPDYYTPVSRARGRVSVPATIIGTRSRGRKVTSATGVSKVSWQRNQAPPTPPCDHQPEVMIMKHTMRPNWRPARRTRSPAAKLDASHAQIAPHPPSSFATAPDWSRRLTEPETLAQLHSSRRHPRGVAPKSRVATPDPERTSRQSAPVRRSERRSRPRGRGRTHPHARGRAGLRACWAATADCLDAGPAFNMPEKLTGPAPRQPVDGV